MQYAELQVTSNFSFLRGASHGEELVVQAKHLGLHALALTDHNSLAGIVRAHVQAKESGLRFVVGARLDLSEAPQSESGPPPTPTLPHKGGGSRPGHLLPLAWEKERRHVLTGRGGIRHGSPDGDRRTPAGAAAGRHS